MLLPPVHPQEARMFARAAAERHDQRRRRRQKLRLELQLRRDPLQQAFEAVRRRAVTVQDFAYTQQEPLFQRLGQVNRGRVHRWIDQGARRTSLAVIR
ncbi:MAG: hypothetical protein R3F17_08645 [Planctomycetota bacterium]